jgi:two-component system, LytTR family, sensor kinase
VGFTFIKSFGAGMGMYIAWFVYYIITLPLFIAHTYLIVYWIGQEYTKGLKLGLFIMWFIIFLYCFSVMELLISHEFLSNWFPDVFETTRQYLTLGNIIINGIGNLYIILVFIAVKMIRRWYFSSEEKKNLNQRLLEDRVAEENSRIQPGLLMYATEKMEEMAQERSEDISSVIATLSEILNGAMLTKDKSMHRIDEELKLLKNLLTLHAIFNDADAPLIQVHGANLDNSMVPSLVILSMMEVSLRTLRKIKRVSVDLLSSVTPFMINITWELEEKTPALPDLLFVREYMNQFFPSRFIFSEQVQNHQYILEMKESV